MNHEACRLNEAQQRALMHTDGPLLVLAGAGSGKTRVITEKIVHLQRACQIPSHLIYALTFTNKAAYEMRLRLVRKMGKEHADKVPISTFHVLGLSMIRQELRHLPLGNHFTLLDEADSIAIIQSLAPKAGRLTKPEAYHIKNQVSRWKSANLFPDEVRLSDEIKGDQTLDYYKRYQQQLLAYSAVDFDDLIMLPTRLLRENALVLERWQAKVAYLLVDEYQDTNHSQYELISRLTQQAKRFTLVGDDDQSIYSWRGARPENIILLKADFPSLEVIMLEENYRSTNTILKAANRLISHNPHAYEKKLWSSRAIGDNIVVLDADDDEDEANQVINSVLADRFQHQTPYSAYAILYRSNHQAAIFEKALRLHQIPYKITGGPSFFSRMEIKDLLSYCRLLINAEDDSALLRVVNTPRRGIGASVLKQLGEYAKMRHVSMFQALGEIGFQERLSEKSRQAVRRFFELIQGLRQYMHQRSPADVCEHMVKQLQYDAWLCSEAQTPAIAEQRIENVRALMDWLGRLPAGAHNRFAEAITTITLMDQDKQQEKTTQAVQLLTMHAAKGLEFDRVYLVGFEEGILPHAVSIEEGNIEEERRIAYVAITRARHHLTISHARTRKRHGKLMRSQVSSFLAELDQACLQRAADHAPTPQALKENNQQQLSRLRQMFKG